MILEPFTVLSPAHASAFFCAIPQSSAFPPGLDHGRRLGVMAPGESQGLWSPLEQVLGKKTPKYAHCFTRSLKLGPPGHSPKLETSLGCGLSTAGGYLGNPRTYVKVRTRTFSQHRY